jgi:hypothetical protein
MKKTPIPNPKQINKQGEDYELYDIESAQSSISAGD